MISEKAKFFFVFALILITAHAVTFLVAHLYVVPTFKALISTS